MKIKIENKIENKKKNEKKIFYPKKIIYSNKFYNKKKNSLWRRNLKYLRKMGFSFKKILNCRQ
jgi:hypothetical protein